MKARQTIASNLEPTVFKDQNGRIHDEIGSEAAVASAAALFRRGAKTVAEFNTIIDNGVGPRANGVGNIVTGVAVVGRGRSLCVCVSLLLRGEALGALDGVGLSLIVAAPSNDGAILVEGESEVVSC